MTPLKFSFHWIDENGKAKGFLAKKGVLDAEILKLDDTEIPIIVICEAEVRSNFVDPVGHDRGG